MIVYLAHDDEAALRRWAEEQPDIIVLDVNPPRLDGSTVCRRIREQADTPIILLTVRGEEVLLRDEPTSALDPISAQRIEEQLRTLKEGTTIVVVTHLLRQARRLADHVIFLWLGELVEAGPAAQVFGAPRDKRTRAYLQGDIG